MGRFISSFIASNFKKIAITIFVIILIRFLISRNKVESKYRSRRGKIVSSTSSERKLVKISFWWTVKIGVILILVYGYPSGLLDFTGYIKVFVIVLLFNLLPDWESMTRKVKIWFAKGLDDY